MNVRIQSPSSALVLGLFADNGFTHATGVPCSLLGGFFFVLESDRSPLRYFASMREDTALGLATGVALGGGRPLVLMQNSGIGYSLNVLTSLTMIYHIGLTMIISWRGHGPDAVEHDIIGKKLTRLLDIFDIGWQVLDANSAKASTVDFLASAADRTRTNALIVTEGFSRA
ncbi:thiamine pyrophosphate-binding protein [Rathayibacter toxicus]|uniref:Uncharacterized protein n=1 Tax=Rathayibacter toxicus TaxID=145458 RepID=A0A0U1PUC0_9MICO|nr:thiamine pyrophosphate-binding protein [Rathayibacter toxicus]KKM46104.1 hypothetical protein VT73_03255 [Rathayibacter toxicus]PPG23056.1 hypothetical protein C5D15_02040 [Rathayibacter toxicus]PPG47638.1 hypothetical protein C5D16_02035 [Rathayibacter toxicus]PPH64509.1 hypothetical protein C5D13_02080 [Rathayibacter toxicus]PPH68701.1 hypothetical protein C5D01_02070 [Rathayibacter toxicus]